MSKKKVIEICQNLNQTIEKMKENTWVQNRNDMFELPRAKKKTLIKIREKLLKKYKELWQKK